MNKDELKAQTVFQEMSQKDKLLEEFESLRPSWKSSLLRFITMFLAMLFLIWQYPEITEQPVLYILLILIFGISAELHGESKRINKRIDALHKLLKSGV